MFSASSCSSISCPDQCVSPRSSIDLGHGNIQGVQPILHSSLTAHVFNPLPFVVAGEGVHDRVESGIGTPVLLEGIREVVVPYQPYSAIIGLVVWSGARAIACIDRRWYRSGGESIPIERCELTLLADKALGARAVEGDGVCNGVFVSETLPGVFADARGAELWYLLWPRRCGYDGL